MRKKSISILLALSLTASLPCGCTVWAEETDDIRQGVPFEELIYTPYDDTILRDLIQEARVLALDPANQDALDEILDQIDEQYLILSEAYTLADLHSYLDVNDEYYAEQEASLNALCTNIDDSLSLLYHDILLSPCKSVLADALDEEDILYYEDYEELSEDVLDLNDQEQILITEYQKVSTQEFKTEIDGTVYNWTSLNQALDDGTIDDGQYFDGCLGLYRAENELLGPIYVELVKVRQEIAKSMGYDNYTDYVYEAIYNRDYTPEDAHLFSREVLKTLVYSSIELYDLYDYDQIAALDARFNAMPVSEQMDLVRPHIQNLDSSLAESFSFLEKYHLYDMDYSPSKMNSGFTLWIPLAEEPFIFNQAGSGFYDLLTIVHEFGHFNAYLAADGEIYNLDLAEIHSQGLEMLFLPSLADILDESEAEAATIYEMDNMLSSILEGCMYDEFQQKVYQMENPTLEDINKLFYKVSNKYGYSFGEDHQAYDWVDVPHNFIDPLYYISYAVSAFPALEIWATAQEDPDKALEIYLELVDSGDQVSYLETLEECGLMSPFEEGAVSHLADVIDYYLDEF